MRLALFLISWFCAASQAASPQSRVDTTAIHELYLEGDFDRAIDLLEIALKYDQLKSHEDSVFAFKHLGVMHTANYETREIGKSFMYQLLMIEPTARIMDMYASDMIYMIFKNIQEEVEITRLRPGKDKPKPIPESSNASDPPRKKALWPYWTAGAVAAGIGVGVTAFLLMDQDPEPGTDHVVED